MPASIYRCKISTFCEFISSNLGSENANKFLSVNTNGSLKFSEIPQAADVVARVEVLEEDVDDIQQELEKLINKKAKNGLRIAVTGDSISTSTTNRCPEILIKSEDVGVQLGGWLTSYDSLPITLGGTTFTSSDIGKYITFTPTSTDVGKSIGNESIYNSANTKVWWEWIMDLGVEVFNATYSSGSMSSHEKSTNNLKTAHGWHDQQIRRLGKRIPGTMKREAPDIIIMFRGCNDMTHSPYVKLTDNYFDGTSWTYPTTDTVDGGYGFKEACSLWVSKVRKAYPEAIIVFATQNNWKRINYSKFPVHNGSFTLPKFNEEIKKIAEFFGCETIDFDKDGITFENMYPKYISDSAATPTHPNNTGHKVMAIKAITDLNSKLDLFNVEPQELEGKVAYQVIANLTDATISNTNPVYTGGTFTATVSSTLPISNVVVTMGGIVVQNAYNPSTNTITVSNVTGDIIITNTIAPTEPVTLTQNLTHATSSNTEGTLDKNRPAHIVITADDGYMIDNITVSMGGVDITNNSYEFYPNGAEINIANVTDDVTLTATTTFVSSEYRVMKEIYGQTNKYISTDIIPNDVGSITSKIHSTAPHNSQGFGFFGYCFCNEYGSNPTKFGIGTSILINNVNVTAGNRYIVKLDNVNTNTGWLKVYDGLDVDMTNLLGSVSRSHTADNPLTYLGFNYTADYACTGQPLCWSKIYDTSNTLSHDYIPVTKISTNEQGLYDLVNDTFLGFVNRV